MRVSVVQMCPGADKAADIAQAGKLLETVIGEDRPGIVALPEMWTGLGGDRETKFREAEDLPAPGSNAPGGPAFELLRATARANGIHVHDGSVAGRAGERLFNTTVVFGPDGEEVARYSDGPGAVTARADPALTARVRRDIPVMEHRRLA